MTNSAYPNFSASSITLDRLDLMTFEARLCSALAHFINFKGHSLQFPLHEPGLIPIFLEEEQKLFLPLRPATSPFEFASSDENIFTNKTANKKSQRAPCLGVFVASGVSDAEKIKVVLPALPAAVELALENTRLYKASISDPVTGLYTRNYLLDSLAKEMNLLRESFSTSATPASHMADVSEENEKSSDKTPIYARGCFALMVIRFNGLRDVVREHGYMLADRLLSALGKELLAHCHEQTLPARSGDYECTLLLPSTTGTECRALALDLLTRLSKANITHELTGKRVHIAPSFGYALCPQDLSGMFASAPEEQARLLLRRARLAAALAHENLLPSAVGIAKNIPVLGFGRILEEGGYILGPLPLSRYLVSLGRTVNAREGQRFAVWHNQDRQVRQNKPSSSELPVNTYKGELVLVEVRENDSLAELVNSTDPYTALEVGDKLLLLPGLGSGIQNTGTDNSPRLDPSTGLMTHSDFMTRWLVVGEKYPSSSLVLLRLSSSEIMSSKEADASQWENLIAQATELSQKILDPTIFPDQLKDFLGGRYGHNSLIFFLPEANPEIVKAACISLAEKLEANFSITLTAGIAPHPFLDFRKTEALENARKALEYSSLLEAPHVGILDSLALNISADKLFSLGESFSAISEYKRAILADNNNTMAWNSLGVCLAALGKPMAALNNFEEALKRAPDDLMALYNLGRLYHAAGKKDEAAKLYQRCLDLSPNHLYALIRLGQLAEGQGENQKARELYLKASEKGEHGLTSRHLAKLAMREGKDQEAREQLHEALLHDPQDAVALQLLASLYLKGGDDPIIAESLARQSVALRPDLKANWIELSKALQTTGKPDEAKKALIKAGAL